MRYQGQEHTVTVPIPEGPLDEANTAEVRRRFDDAHERLYTFRLDVPAELVTFRLTGYGTVPKPPLREMAAGGDASAARTGSRMIDFDERGRAEAAVFDRRRTRCGRRDRRACRDRGDGDDDARAARHVGDRRPLRKYHRPNRSLNDAERAARAGPVHDRGRQGRPGRRGRRDVRDAAADVDEPDHLRGSRLRQRADRRERAADHAGPGRHRVHRDADDERRGRAGEMGRAGSSPATS